MHCPACGMEMVRIDFGAAEVEVCRDGCGGIWFELQERAGLEEPHEGFDRSLEEAIHDHREGLKGRGQIQCPECSIPMQVHGYRGLEDVRVRECYKCGGVFLDPAELKRLRDSLKQTESEKQGEDNRLKENREFQAAMEFLSTSSHERQGRISRTFLKPRAPAMRRYAMMTAASMVCFGLIALLLSRGC